MLASDVIFCVNAFNATTCRAVEIGCDLDWLLQQEDDLLDRQEKQRILPQHEDGKGTLTCSCGTKEKQILHVIIFRGRPGRERGWLS